MKVLVTGAGGFIGKHVLSALTRKNIPVVACSRAFIKSSGDVEQFRCDLMDRKVVDALCEQVGATHLLHLAWMPQTGGAYWNSSENLLWLNASRQLFESFAAAGGRRIVGTGTGVEYSPVEEVRFEDITPTCPDTLYGKAKLACACFLRVVADALSISGAWARLFYLTGPAEPSQRLVPSAFRALKDGRRFQCTNGDSILDYMDVRDAANALVALLLSDMQSVCNVASGRGVRIKDMLKKVLEITRRATDMLVFEQKEPVRTVIAGTDRLCKELYFAATYTVQQSLLDCGENL